MSVLKLRILNLKINKVFIYFLITVLATWNLWIILKPCTPKYSLSLRYLEDDNTYCAMELIESGWLLNLFGDLDLGPMDTRIFFHATSCKGGLTSRQACALESTARAHPNWDIIVIFVGKIDTNFKRGYLYKALQTLDNVDFSAIDLIRYLQGTPLETINLSQVMEMTRKYNLADLLKYVTLYKFGGVYMDMDFIVVQSFDDLGTNFVGRPSPNRLGPDVLSFSNNVLGRIVANATIRELAEMPNPLPGDGGLEVLTRALEKICTAKTVDEMTAKTCRGLKFYGDPEFYPESYDDVAAFYNPDTGQNTEKPYTVYAHRMWSDFTGISKFPNDSKIIKLASTFCPTVFDVYGDDFGI